MAHVAYIYSSCIAENGLETFCVILTDNNLNNMYCL